MQNFRLVIIAILGIALGLVIGFLGTFWVIRGGPRTTYTPITAPTLDLNAQPTLDPTQAVMAVTSVALLNAENANLHATIAALESLLGGAATQPPIVATEAPTLTQSPAAGDASQRALYRINSSQSEVRFSVEEERNGTRADVVGTTDQLAGDVIVDRLNPVNSQIGTIRMSARALTTGDAARDVVLREQIFRSAQDAYEFIEFVPTAVTGLPETIYLAQTYTFQVTGNLTILDTTRETIFNVQAQMPIESQFNGTATATITWFDWGINVPSVPGITDVAAQANLVINFVANRVNS
ncbi:YceI family protein [Phototrophicus methaneseepsis]|uniref:YceI family protein n=1 Tax=Phototrophicus methaneseepsis TaxID=2710758 RepID=A0A7S8EBM8_9CHLR|nr:YceI family protein [Phototrophicus methaneseepsis]QPC83957.1 YceI family protein [Phototrophicus methaneseepsis]